MTRAPGLLPDERSLIEAEQTLTLWASLLADAGRDRDAAEAMRVQSTILKFRLDFLQSEKS